MWTPLETALVHRLRRAAVYVLCSLQGLTTEGKMGLMVDADSGAGRILLERIRQVDEKGWTRQHDREEHADGSLLDLAAALCANEAGEEGLADLIAAGSAGWVTPCLRHILGKYADERERILEIAAALIAAELDRIDGGAS